MAREFWAEVYAVRMPLADSREERRDRPARMKARKALVRRSARRPLR